jgi:O-antigen ligase
MKKTVTALMVVSLAGNIFPVINIVAISSLVPLYLISRDTEELKRSGYGPETAKKLLVVAYFYWLLSYALTGATLENLVSFDFLRFDGALFIAYLPLLLVTDVRLDPLFIRRIVGVFLTIMSVVALVGLAEFFNGTIGSLLLSRLPEPLQFLHDASLSSDIFQGFFRAHNAAGGIYAMAALIAFSLLILGKNPTFRSVPTFWVACNFVGLVLTQSRTGYLGFVGALLLVFFRRRETRRNAFKYSVLILVPLYYLLQVQPVVNQRTEAVSDLEDPNVVMRFVYYQRAFDDFVQSPIIGTGFGRFNDDLKGFVGIPNLVFVATSGQSVNDDLHAHNSYLHFLAEGGIIGMGLMLSVWISTFLWIEREKTIFAQGSFGRCLAEGIQACIILEFAMSFTEHMMGTATSSLTVYTFSGLFLNLVGWKYRVASVVVPQKPASGELQACPER